MTTQAEASRRSLNRGAIVFLGAILPWMLLYPSYVAEHRIVGYFLRREAVNGVARVSSGFVTTADGVSFGISFLIGAILVFLLLKRAPALRPYFLVAYCISVGIFAFHFFTLPT